MVKPRWTPSLGLSLPAASAPSSCPCGSGVSLSQCCGRIHADHFSAQTAEQLMRARYSAFALRRRAFLEVSWHPSTRPSTVDLDDAAEWTGLTIQSLTAGGPNDNAGQVAFTARFRDTTNPADDEQQLIEHSRFVRENGRWFYLDAIS